LVNIDFERMWKKVVIAYFEVYFSICLEVLRKTVKGFSWGIWSLGQDLGQNLPSVRKEY
jgi:hypothetical protein